jgi:hypothetical protein
LFIEVLATILLHGKTIVEWLRALTGLVLSNSEVSKRSGAHKRPNKS